MRQVLMAALVMFLIQPVVYADQAGTGSGGHSLSAGLATSSTAGWQRANTSGPATRVTYWRHYGKSDGVADRDRVPAFGGGI